MAIPDGTAAANGGLSRRRDTLVAAAWAARAHAHAPFSGFKVGAALLGRDAEGKERIFTGCNVENASYGLTICAERTAIFKAISEGGRDFTTIAIVADSRELTPPCGACRQIIWEFCGDIPVWLANLAGQQAEHRMAALLPHAFDAGMLGPPA